MRRAGGPLEPAGAERSTAGHAARGAFFVRPGHGAIAWCRIRGESFDAWVEPGERTPGAPNPNQEIRAMRFMVIVKADKDSEAGILPDQKLLEDMTKYNEELAKAGVMLAGEGLHPSSKGARVRFSGDERTVIDGPFAETKELVAGYWLFKADSLDDAIEWVKRAPNPFPGTESEIEIRQVFEADDFGEEFTPELRAAEERLMAQAAANAKR
jgi:hypothetical protein